MARAQDDSQDLKAARSQTAQGRLAFGKVEIEKAK